MQIKNLLNIKQLTSDQQPAVAQNEKGQALKAELLPGRLLKATVLDYLPNGNTLLDIDGRTISALCRTPLDKTTLWLEVLQGGETPILGPAGKQGAVRQFLKFFLGSGEELNRALVALNRLTTALDRNIPPEFNFLRVFREIVTNAEASPVNLIKLLHLLHLPSRGNTRPANLAEQLSKLLDELEHPTPYLVESDIAALKKMAGYLKTIHELNQQPGPANQENLLLYPCFFAGENGWGQWMFNAERGVSADSAKNYQLNFFLEMSRIGELHCRLAVAARNIQGCFFCASEEVSSHFSGTLPQLRKILTGLGYQRIALSSQAATPSLRQRLKTKLEEKVGKAAVAIVDIKA